jgi:predicted outer membrane repeat protein
LTIPGSGEDNNASGDLDVRAEASDALTITGAGAASTIIQQTTADRVLHIRAGNFSISNVTLTGGNITGNGGGMSNEAANTAAIANTIFSNNSAAGGFHGGGGLYVGGGTVNVAGSSFINNTAAPDSDGGGAIFSSGDNGAKALNITDSSFSGNQANGLYGSGGAINSTADLTITGSTFSGNQANGTNSGSGDGGAVYHIIGVAAISNSTFSGNSTRQNGGGIYYRNDGMLDLTNVTLASNTADSDNNGTGDGGGLFSEDSGGSGSVVGNTLIAGNTDMGGEAPDCGGYDVSSIGNNLIQNTTGCTITNIIVGNITGQDPLLAALANNGGPTETRALQVGSPAINAASNSMCAAAPVNGIDQRGVTRPQAVVCDIGAYEFSDTTPPDVTINQAVGQADPTNASPINFTVIFSETTTNFATGDVTLSGTAGATAAIVTGSGTTYNVAVSGMTGNGTVIASVSAGMATDATGNPNTASTSADNTVLYDATPPSVTINQAAGQVDPTNASPINFTVVFSETTANFVTGDVTLSGTAGATTAIVTGSGTTYNVAVSGMIGSGTVIANVAAGAATDSANNGNLASTSTDNTVTYDITAPGVTINQASGQADPTSVSPINFTVTFNKAVTGFATGDITLSGTAGATTGTVTQIAPNNGTTYNVAVSGMTASGTVIANVAAGAANDSVGNPNSASTSTDNTVTLIPTVTFTAASQTSAGESGSMTITAQLSAISPSAVSVPFTVNGASTASGTDYSISASPITINAGSLTGTITITITPDSLDENNETVIVNMGIPTNAVQGVTLTHTATITDDDTAGITVTPTTGLITTEAGATATFTVVLNSQPTANVTVGLSSSNITEGTVSTTGLTFTTANWNTAQTVTVTGVNDFVDDGNVAYTILTATAISADALYNVINPADVSLTNTDDDTAGITVTPTTGLITTEAGATATFTVVLNSQPTADVIVGLTSSDTTEGTVIPASLTFTTANWNVAQTVTVTGVDDSIDDGDIAYTIITAAAVSADVLYTGVDPSNVDVVNTDDDTFGQDYVCNGSFEKYPNPRTRVPTCWHPAKFGPYDGKNTQFKKAGFKSLSFIGVRGKSSAAVQIIPLVGKEGDPFTFSFWVRGADISESGKCAGHVYLYNGHDLHQTKTMLCPIGNYGFTKMEVHFTANAAYTMAVIKFSYTKFIGQVWFDAVSLIR